MGRGEMGLVLARAWGWLAGCLDGMGWIRVLEERIMLYGRLVCMCVACLGDES